MSLDALDLNLGETVTEIIEFVSSARVVVVKRVEANPDQNPFESTQPTPVIVLDVPGISFKQLSARSTSQLFGVDDKEYFSCQIAYPPVSISNLQECYVYVDFSRGFKLFTGIIKRIDIKLSTLVNVYMQSNEATPWDWETIRTYLNDV